MKQFLVPSVLSLFILSTYQHEHGLVPDQPGYNCFEEDPEPVDTDEEFLDYCKDYAGNVHYEFANLTSCCECIRYECINFGELNEQKYYFWNKSISEHCCLHCDGTVYKADTVIETVVEKDECGTIKTSVCRKNDGGIANIEKDFNYKSCCNDEEGILPINEIKLEPLTCSERTCKYSTSSQHSSWISTQILPGCNCCVVDGKLVPDGHSWFIDWQEYECCEGKIVAVIDGSGSGEEIDEIEGDQVEGLLMDNELGVLITFAVVYVGNPPTDECPKYGGVNQKGGTKNYPMGVKCKIDRITASAAFPNTKGVTCTPDTSVGTGRACLVSLKNNQPDTCVVVCA